MEGIFFNSHNFKISLYSIYQNVCWFMREWAIYLLEVCALEWVWWEQLAVLCGGPAEKEVDTACCLWAPLWLGAGSSVDFHMTCLWLRWQCVWTFWNRDLGVNVPRSLKREHFPGLCVYQLALLPKTSLQIKPRRNVKGAPKGTQTSQSGLFAEH